MPLNYYLLNFKIKLYNLGIINLLIFNLIDSNSNLNKYIYKLKSILFVFLWYP